MVNINDNTPQDKSSVSWLDSPTVKAGGAVAAVAATYFMATDAIRRAFFKTMNKGTNGAFHDLQDARDKAISEIVAPAKSGHSVPDAMDRVKEINSIYDNAYLERRKLLNIKGTIDEMKALKHHQWIEAIFATGAVASVAVGAILAIASNRETALKSAKIAGKDDSIDQKTDIIAKNTDIIARKEDRLLNDVEAGRSR